MRMKQIIAKDMKEAMLIARETLGEDAVLLTSQKQAGSKSIVVTFAIEEEAYEEQFDSAHEAAASNDNQVASPSAAKAATTPAQPAKKTHLQVPRSSYPAYDLLLSIMKYHRMPENLFIHLTALLDKIELPDQLSYDSCESIMAQLLASHVALRPLDLQGNLQTRALMFVGPHGVGKTSLVAKYATQAHLAGLPVMLFTTDNERLAGTAMLEPVQKLLGCELMIVENRTQLRNLIKSQLGKALLLIDSPGVNMYHFQQMKTLGEFASLADVEPILTIAAGMDTDEALELASVFSFLNIERFALTRADSARHFSSIFSLLGEGYALAAISDNSKVSEIAKPASHALLAQLICAHIKERMA